MSLLDQFTRTPSSAKVHVWQEKLLEQATSGHMVLVSGRRGGKTAAAAAMGGAGGSGTVNVSSGHWTFPSMAHPIWPYGTVIKPTIHNSVFHEDTRQMVVGRQPNDSRVLVTIDLRTETPYAHLLEDIEDRWEVEEAP